MIKKWISIGIAILFLVNVYGCNQQIESSHSGGENSVSEPEQTVVNTVIPYIDGSYTVPQPPDLKEGRIGGRNFLADLSLQEQQIYGVCDGKIFAQIRDKGSTDTIIPVTVCDIETGEKHTFGEILPITWNFTSGGNVFMPNHCYYEFLGYTDKSGAAMQGMMEVNCEAETVTYYPISHMQLPEVDSWVEYAVISPTQFVILVRYRDQVEEKSYFRVLRFDTETKLLQSVLEKEVKKDGLNFDTVIQIAAEQEQIYLLCAHTSRKGSGVIMADDYYIEVYNTQGQKQYQWDLTDLVSRYDVEDSVRYFDCMGGIFWLRGWLGTMRAYRQTEDGLEYIDLGVMSDGLLDRYAEEQGETFGLGEQLTVINGNGFYDEENFPYVYLSARFVQNVLYVYNTKTEQMFHLRLIPEIEEDLSQKTLYFWGNGNGDVIAMISYIGSESSMDEQYYISSETILQNMELCEF